MVIDVEGTPAQTPSSGAFHVHHFRRAVATRWRYERGRTTREESASFGTIVDFWAWLISRLDRKRVTWVWGHSIGYDLTALRVWERIERGDLHFGEAVTHSGRDVLAGKSPRVWKGCIVTGDPPTILGCRTRCGRPVKFLDILNWANCTIDELADVLGMEPPPVVADEAGDDLVQVKLRHRAAIIRSAVEEICDMVRTQCLGNMAPTVASQASHAWRHPSIPCRILPTEDGNARRLERAAYYGGKIHVYYEGNVIESAAAGLERMTGQNPLMATVAVGPVYHLDVVSCYGSVMIGNRFPVNHVKTLIDPTVAELRGLLGAFCVIADVDIHTGGEPFPLRRHGDVGYFTGRFRTQLAGPELIRALEANAIHEVYRAQVYVADEPFNDFVRKCWSIRNLYLLAGRRFQARLAKHLMATLHGKLAQRSPRWEVASDLVAPQPWGQYAEMDAATGLIVQYRSIGGTVQVRGDQSEPPDAVPALSAYVTSYARELMLSIRWAAGYRGVLYEDADSLHVTQAGFDELSRRGWIDEHALGKCRVVAKADRATYYGKKDYELGTKIVRAGKQREAVQKPSGDWQQTDFARLDSLLSGRPPVGPLAYDRSMVLEHPPSGASVGPDGWTRPIRLS
jgi:hypothetical protein